METFVKKNSLVVSKFVTLKNSSNLNNFDFYERVKYELMDKGPNLCLVNIVFTGNGQHLKIRSKQP